MTKPMRKIAILTPIARAPMPEFMASIMNICGTALFDEPTEIAWLKAVGHANTPRVRNALAHTALNWGADELIWIDDDISFDRQAFLDLFKHDVDIVAGAPQRRSDDPSTPIKFCASLDNPAKTLGDLLSGYAATAFLRTKRCVYDKMKPTLKTFTHENFKGDITAYFDYKIGPSPSGKEISYNGEDFYFCQVARDLGFDVWIDPTIQLSHWNNAPLSMKMSDALGVEP